MIMLNRKSLFHKTVSLLIVICMMLSTVMPMIPLSVSAEAPETYTTIKTDSTAQVHIHEAYTAEYFEFVPKCSGTYRFYSANNVSDPKCALLDESGYELYSDDDGGDDSNFSFTYYCHENTTYYIKAYMWSSNTGSYTLHVETVEIDCEHDYVLQSATAVDCENDGVEVYVCSLCETVRRDVIATAYGHSYTDGVCVNCGAAAPTADSWDGTVNTAWYNSESTEFTLDTAEKLAGLATLVNSGYSFYGKTINLGNNIDLEGYDWTPIGGVNNAFKGTFNGNQYIIYNMTITGTYRSAGLFGNSINATFSNLGLENVNINVDYSGGDAFVGALAGVVDNGTVTNCYMEGSVASTNNDQHPTGGLVGLMDSGTMSNCYAISTVTMTSTDTVLHAGGLIGATGWNHNETVRIEKCYAVSTVTATSTSNNSPSGGAGGLIGENYATNCTVSDCFVLDSMITSNGSSGAIYAAQNESGVSLVRCYYAGTNASDSYGGVTMDVANLKSQSWIEANLGWDFDTTWAFIAGNNYPVLQGFDGSLRHAHEYVETSRTEATCAVNGVVVSTCSVCGQTRETVIQAPGHSYVNGVCTVCGAAAPSADTWDGTVDTSWYDDNNSEFTIDTAEQLAGLAYLVNSGYSFSGMTVYLGNSMDLADIEWTPIGMGMNTNDWSNAFKGTFDGCHYVVSNVRISDLAYHYGGFFGSLEDATVKNLGIENVDYTVDSDSRVGGLCGGMIDSTIDGCYVKGDMSVSLNSGNGNHFGGIVGDMHGGAVLKNSYAVCTIQYTSNVTGLSLGGLVGIVCAEGTKSIENCYADCSIYRSNDSVYSGGIVGELWCGHLDLINCFSVSTIDGEYVNMIIGYKGVDFSPTVYVNNGYYPSNGSSYYGTATDAINFTSQSWILTNLGWDFDTVWEFVEGEDYPILQGFDGSLRHAHEYVETSRTEATCAVNGVVVSTCSVCGQTRETVIQAPGHSYVNGVCTVCGAAAPSADTWDGTVDTSWYNDSDTEFIIYTAEELAGLAALVNSGYSFNGKTILLDGDIDLSDHEWTPIGVGSSYDNFNYAFTGTFDGQFHTIYGLSITNTSSKNVGLFGMLKNATVENLAIAEAYINIEQDGSNNGTVAGIVVGSMYSTAINCVTVTGDVTVRTLYSGICCVALAVGYVHNGNSSAVTNVAAAGNVSGYCSGFNSYVGGIVGVKNYSEGSLLVENCIFNGTISATDATSDSYAGGILGISCGGENVKNCIFIGEIFSNDSKDAILDDYLSTNVSNCYYDGSFYSERGTAVSLSDFQSQSWIEANLGWDFDTTWAFIAGNDYPVLQGFDGSLRHAHEYVETSRTEATCTAVGAVISICSVCGREQLTVIPMIDHTMEETSRTEATCTVDGVIVNTCSACGHEEETVIEALGHNFVDRVCTRCGSARSGIVLLLEDDLPWGYNSNSITLQRLVDEGQIEGFEKHYSYEVANGSLDLNDYSVVVMASNQERTFYNNLSATVLEAYVNGGGALLLTDTNGGFYSTFPFGIISTYGSSNNNYIVDPTHPMITGIYSNNQVLTNSDMYGSAINHNYFTNLPDNANVILRDGESRATLLEFAYGNGFVVVSGLTFEFAIEHSWGFAPGYDDIIVSLYVSNSNRHIHDYEEISRVNATCTDDGAAEYVCSSCGATRFTVIPATGHNIVTVVEVEVTCTTPGLIVDRCTNEGCDYEKQTTVYSSHNYTVTNRVEAVCETPGYIEYTCTNCDDVKYEYFYGVHDYVESYRVEAQVGAEGSVTYTCSGCGDSYSITLPALLPVLKNSAVLLIQDSLPWSENVNTSLLNALKERGVVSSYNIINTSSLGSIDLTQYGVVMIANDQSSSMYTALATHAEKLENYVMAGGNLIYGACDAGWGGGSISHALPGGVTTSNYYSVYNYIVNDLHPIVTGVYTDNRSLRDELLKGNYCSHTYFDLDTLPEGTDIILRDANGNPTLIEYTLGSGTVIATGLTWEYFYVRDHYDMVTNYSKYAYDDLVTYMVYMSSTCEHNYEVAETVEASCEANGYTKYVCALCGHEYLGDVVVATGHSYTEQSHTEPTCAANGSIVSACDCGATRTEIIPAIPHTWEVSREEPTCTDYGALTYTCSCGATKSELILPTQHNYQIVNVVEATCVANGRIEFACQNDGCGAVKYQIIDVLDHAFGDDNVCDSCGFEYAVHTHAYDTVTVVAPTCTAAGYTEHACYCGYSYRDAYVEPTRHLWNNGVITSDATCVSDGLITYRCITCDATKTAVIPAAHQWIILDTVAKTCTTDGSVSKACTACGEETVEIIPASHNWNNGTVMTEATCEEDGLKVCVCLDCGETQGFAIPKLGHYYINGVCERCGESFIDNVTPSVHPLYGMYFELEDVLSDYGPSLIDEYGVMLDYNEGAVFEKVAVFLTQDGTMWRRCIAIKGTGIQYATYVPYLSYRGEIQYTGLNHDWINIFRLTEHADGIWTYSDYVTIGVNLQDAYGNLLLSLYDIGQAGAQTRIFDDLDEMIAWLGEDCFDHAESDWIIDREATCLAGERHKECTVCGKVLATEEIPPVAEHSLTDWIVDVEATCVAGHMHVECTVCGSVVASEEIPPVADHVAGDWIVDMAPTATNTGLRHKECATCGTTLETDVMDILAKFVISNVEAGAGSTVRVTIDIQNNPGIVGAVLSIAYDPALRLVGAEAGSALNSLSFTLPNEFANPCNFVWDGVNVADFSDGAVLVLIFEVPTGVETGSVYNISASYTFGNMINAELEAVDVEIENGSITVINPVGDANCDGIVDVADVVAMRRYIAGGYGVEIDEIAADLDSDGYITVTDIVLLRRMLVG